MHTVLYTRPNAHQVTTQRPSRVQHTYIHLISRLVGINVPNGGTDEGYRCQRAATTANHLCHRCVLGPASYIWFFRHSAKMYDRRHAPSRKYHTNYKSGSGQLFACLPNAAKDRHCHKLFATKKPAAPQPKIPSSHQHGRHPFHHTTRHPFQPGPYGYHSTQQ